MMKKLSVGVFLKAAMAATSLSTMSPGQDAQASEHSGAATLEGLTHYEDGQRQRREFSFDGESFYFVYFGVREAIYEDCASNIINMNMYASAIERRVQDPVSIQSVFVSMPPQEGVGRRDMWQRFILNDADNPILNYIGLTGSLSEVRERGRTYGARYIIDRHTGEISDHSQAYVLIGPHGERLRVIPQASENSENMFEQAAQAIEDYRARERECRTRPATCEV